MSFEANKIAGAILAALILAMVSGLLSDVLVRPTELAKPVYEVAGGPAPGATSAAPAAPAGPAPIAPLMAKASASTGKEKTQICSACHTFNKGGPNRIGPNLYGVVGTPIAEDRGGFAFSDALKTKGKGQTWTLANLNHWLFKPQDFAKGTKMTFVGFPKAEDRANVIAFLNSNSDKPESIDQLVASGEKAPEKPPAQVQSHAAAAPSAPGGIEPIAPLMAKASVNEGKEKTQICSACHTFNKGGPNRIGPNLYGIVGSPIAEDRNNYPFSDALKTKGKGQIWTLANLNAWLAGPQHFAKGTKMTFAGFPKAKDRANVIAYLNSNSDKPEPLSALAAGSTDGASQNGKAATPSGSK